MKYKHRETGEVVEATYARYTETFWVGVDRMAIVKNPKIFSTNDFHANYEPLE